MQQYCWFSCKFTVVFEDNNNIIRCTCITVSFRGIDTNYEASILHKINVMHDDYLTLISKINLLAIVAKGACIIMIGSLFWNSNNFERQLAQYYLQRELEMFAWYSYIHIANYNFSHDRFKILIGLIKISSYHVFKVLQSRHLDSLVYYAVCSSSFSSME